MKTYKLTEDQLIQIARLCNQEQGTVKGAAAEASLMANILEGSATYQKRYGDDIYSFVRNSGWFSRAPYWMDHGTTTAAITEAVRDVLINGNRTLPLYVDEHDCFSDITSATSCGEAINKSQRAAYQRDVTRIKNRYGSTYTFYCFPDEHSDPFGYIDKPAPTAKVTAQAAIRMMQSYIGYEEKKTANYLDDWHANAGKNNFTRFQPLAGAGNGDQWCQYTIDACFVELTGSIRKARKILCMTENDKAMTGYTPDGVKAFRDAKRYYTEPEPGDIVYFYSTAKARVGHVGIVAWVDKGRKMIGTIEGNTSGSEYSENGGTVATHEYSYAAVGGKNRINGFGRPRYETEGGWSKDMDNRAYIANTYMDELYRPASEQELTHWENEIEKGKTYDNVLAGIRNSEEGMLAWIDRCYWMLLEREADPDGRAAWLKAMKAGMNRATVRERFIASQEYQNLHKDD